MDIKQINQVTIVGAGIMGIGIAQNFAQAGFKVILVDIKSDILDNAMLQIKENLKLFQEYQLLRDPEDKIISRINTGLLDSAGKVISQCDYIVEAIPEKLEAKKLLLAKLEKLNSKATIASNTSSFTINELSTEMTKPARLVGVHFFNPAHIIPIVEIHRGDSTSEEVLNLTYELMQKIGKKPIWVRKNIPGFIVNRLTGALEREIDHLLLEEVVTPEDLDTAVKGSIGFRLSCLGPQETEDMIGLDTSMLVSNRVYKTLSNSIEASPQLAAKVEAGELGIKSGKGWYDYTQTPRSQVLNKNNRKLIQQLIKYNAENDSLSP